LLEKSIMLDFELAVSRIYGAAIELILFEAEVAYAFISFKVRPQPGMATRRHPVSDLEA
jgi:hypothetical protein